jgi:nitrite reductase/ring-hydroxylating ferredoxin subunit
MSVSAHNLLQAYLRRLTNLSGNNRSLLLLRLPAEQMVDLHEFNFLKNNFSFEIIQSLIEGKDKKLCQVLDSRVEANNELSKRLKKLQRIDHFIFEERGSNDLHVGWPFIRGKFSDGTLVRCPLLFFPVTLVQQGQYWVLQLREDAGVTLNKSFLMAYSFYNKVKLEEDLFDLSIEDLEHDSTVFRTQLYELLKEKIEINFNPDNFQDTLTAFQIFKRQEFDELHRNGELKLFPEAVLGMFPQAGSQLVPDYLELLDNEQLHEVQDLFEKNETNGEAGAVHVNTTVKEEKLFTPFLLDAYQENAIKAVKNGHSIVVQGPPGTGKSQLICNLLADAIASGKRALLVCQKRAALDVVYARMQSAGLDDFLGLVHDFRNDRKLIFSKVARQIEKVEEYQARNRSVDVIQTERTFFQICRRIDQITEELEEFRAALYHDGECNLTVKELYLTSSMTQPVINIKQEYRYFPFSVVSEFINKLKAYALYADKFNDPAYAWYDRRSFSTFTPLDEGEIENKISDVIAYQKQVSEKLFRLTGVALNLRDALTLLQREDEIMGMLGVLKDRDTYRFFQTMIDEGEDETSMLWLANMERVTLNCFEEDGPEVSIPTDMLGKYQEALYQCMNAKTNFFKLIKWELFSKNKFLIKRLLVVNDLAYNRYGLQALEQRIDCRLNLEHHLTALKNKRWLIDIPSDYKKESLQRWFNKQKFAIRAKFIFHSLREIKEAIHVQKISQQDFHHLMRNIVAVIAEIPHKMSEWQQHLSAYQINQLIAEPSKEKILVSTLREDFDSLCAFDKLREELQAHEHEVIGKLYAAVAKWDAPKMEKLFQNSLRLAWLDHIETKFPILRSVSSLKMDQLQHELQELIESKQKISHEILMVRARENVYDNIVFNRLNNRVTFRDLQHQVAKKKKIWPLRKVISSFKEEIFKVIPCWMASPESVSAIFPMEELFDLVIFDEASQCFAERGIPALFRGKQVVIAGDNQQLRPNELYQVRWETDEENPDLEVESLLELGERYLSTMHLQGHYRSKSLELIQFSNSHFYGDRLRLVPDRLLINQGEPGIEYVKVDGIWEDQTNLTEAQALVKRVLSLISLHPQKEIGIVTFNAPQQSLILDLLEAEAASAGVTIPPSLFVKNIENVQGDEKDIIVFSVGYAPDKKGNLNMQFGSLNVAGGENRLNVAITRAREKIILFTSITPEQLVTQHARNEGPKLLRKYLEFAREVSERRFSPRSGYPQIRQHENWYLNRQLQVWGEQRLTGFDFQVGSLPYADVNVNQANRYLGIILTDDDRYYHALSAKDAHAYTPALLTRNNWRYHQVFSRNFWKDFSKVESELMLFIGHQV